MRGLSALAEVVERKAAEWRGWEFTLESRALDVSMVHKVALHAREIEGEQRTWTRVWDGRVFEHAKHPAQIVEKAFDEAKAFWTNVELALPREGAEGAVAPIRKAGA